MLVPQALPALTLNILVLADTDVVASTVIELVPAPDVIFHPDGTVQL